MICQCKKDVEVLYPVGRPGKGGLITLLLCLACLTWEEVKSYPVTAQLWRKQKGA